MKQGSNPGYSQIEKRIERGSVGLIPLDSVIGTFLHMIFSAFSLPFPQQLIQPVSSHFPTSSIFYLKYPLVFPTLLKLNKDFPSQKFKIIPWRAVHVSVTCLSPFWYLSVWRAGLCLPVSRQQSVCPS